MARKPSSGCSSLANRVHRTVDIILHSLLNTQLGHAVRKVLGTPEGRGLRVPPPPTVLLAHPREMFFPARPRNTKYDTPLACIYRIYWSIVMDNTIMLRNEIEYFWSRKEDSWKVSSIPEPPDSSPERLAVIAAITFILAAAFNRLIDLGLPRTSVKSILTNEEIAKLALEPKVLESPPQWASAVPSLEQPLILPTSDLATPMSQDDEGTDPFMAMKNVLVCRLHVYFT